MEQGYHYKKGLWTVEEDKILMDYIRVNGKGRWNHIAKVTGLQRCGKSCRLRWMNYLSPNVKKGDFSEDEDDLIIRLHNLLGNRWSLIAGRVPGRTDNQVKNHWNTHLSKKLGIKKERNKVGNRSKTLSRECRVEVETLIRPPSDQNLMAPSCESSRGGDIIHQANEGSQELVIGVPDAPERETDGFFVDCCSFWSRNDELNQVSPALVELLAGYPLDMDWPDL
ncbi:hypothetical protein NE237_021262 [Protea cynaroides]|uniref:Uncharacterized protein n=1 Tax=Protea cynaroides TaxID=273540 RepID=A0A9Q0K3D2_9MAGN|nr:hypothetical protein NE237_021262 [Protea cynaroides]